MKEADPDLRWGGVVALSHLAEPGSSRPLEALAKQARAQEVWLKCAAVHALGLVAVPDGGPGEEAVKAALNDPNDQVRRVATVTMQQVSERECGPGTREKSKGYFPLRWFGQ